MAEESVNPEDIKYVNKEDGSVEAHINPYKEEDLDDVRDDIAEQVFLELDICIKAYQQSFGEDHIFNMLEFSHSNVAMLLQIHKNNHTLYDVNIDDFDIPESKYKNHKGEVITKVYNLLDIDKLGYICNLLHNANLGLYELSKSQYFSSNTGEYKSVTFIEPERIISLISMKIEETILYTNTILNKLYKK